MFLNVSIKNSSFIRRLCYEKGILEVYIKDKSYKYNINDKCFIDFIFADSKGKFYNQNVKGKKLKSTM